MKTPQLSIIIPAYNEESHLGETLECLMNFLRQSPFSRYEIIVSNDDSSDRTVEIAELFGAKVVHSGKRNIGATRNVGAAHAEGDFLLFLDADTLVSLDLLNALGKAIAQGYVGGGARIEWSEAVSWKGRLPLWVWNTLAGWWTLPAGSFLFVQRRIFETIGGFNETLFAAEELDLTRRLKQRGRLIILSQPVRTSPRKLKQFSKREILSLYRRVALSPRRVLQDREQLELWYERRE